MGWNYTNKPAGLTVPKFLKEELRSQTPDETGEITELKKEGRAYYAAYKRTCKTTGTSRTSGLVILTDSPPGGRGYENFGYKLIGEFAGPVDTQCPGSILKKLSPVSDFAAQGYSADSREYARKWREECQNYNETQEILTQKLIPGAVVRLDPPVLLKQGGSIERFEIRNLSPFYMIALDPLREIKGANKRWLLDKLSNKEAYFLT